MGDEVEDELTLLRRVEVLARDTRCCVSSECTGDHEEPLREALAALDEYRGRAK